MDQASFQDFVIEHGIIGFFEKPLTLKSGRQSHFYVNWRKACSDAYLLDQLTDYMTDFLKKTGWQFDCLYGVPEGASKAAIIAGLKLARLSDHYAPGRHRIPMGRAKPKDHGSPEDRYFIGIPEGRVVVLEDTITTGLSLLKAIDELLEQKLQVVAVLGLTDRMEIRDDGRSVAEAIAERYQNRIQYRAMSRATDLLPLAIQNLKPTLEIQNAIVAEFKQQGINLKIDTRLN